MNEIRDRHGATPTLSVVVVSLNRANLLDRCLAALVSQPGAKQIEIHVISKRPCPDVPPDGGHASRINWHQVAATITIPEMRTLGIERSTAGLLALLEDDCLVGPQWLQSVLAAHQSGYPAIGGAIEPGDFSSGLDWGVFYCEYARFLAPFSGTVKALPGNNVSYKRKAIDPTLTGQGFYEVFIHEKLQTSGNGLFAESGMVVKNVNSWRFKDCSVSPFHHGRAYAGQRLGPKFSARRLIYGLLAVLLPIVKTFRTLREIQSRKRKDLPLFKALLWIIVFQSCWSMGELMGYLAGPGDSIEKWR